MSGKILYGKVVYFDPYPKYKRIRVEGDTWDILFETYAEYFYSRRWTPTALVSATNGVIELTWDHWYIPGWWMRRKVATIASEVGVGGTATFQTELAVLED